VRRDRARAIDLTALEINDSAIGKPNTEHHINKTVIVIVATELVVVAGYYANIEPSVWGGLTPILAVPLDAGDKLLITH
jgi:hypothetical protein